MFIKERAREVRIKNANTDWWIHEQAMVGANGLTYIVYVNHMGEIHIKEFDAKCSNSISRDVCVCRFNFDYADEHNAPSVCILENGKIIVMYTGHAVGGGLRYRITAKPYDIMSFGEEKSIPMDKSVTYVQLSENTQKGEVWLFTRVDSVNWQFRFSKDDGETWSEGNTFLHSESGGLFYLDVRKQIVPTETGADEQWFFALYGHPLLSKDHTIRSGIFTSDGDLINHDKTALGINLYREGNQMDLETLSVVYEAPEGETVRLLAVSPTLPLRVGLCAFRLDDAPSATYFCASYRDGNWNLSAPIAGAGAFLSDKQTDGSQTYVPGMAFYYGVGEAGLYPTHGGRAETNRIYLARKGETKWLVESYITHDGGKIYEREEVLREIPLERNLKIWRPTVPIHAQDNLPVYWHEGTYTAHTGGWNCDAVMLVEFDY